MKIRSLFWTCCGALLLLTTLTACEDPSNVGLGLVGEQGGNAEVFSLSPTKVAVVRWNGTCGCWTQERPPSDRTPRST